MQFHRIVEIRVTRPSGTNRPAELGVHLPHVVGLTLGHALRHIDVFRWNLDVVQRFIPGFGALGVVDSQNFGLMMLDLPNSRVAQSFF